MEIGTVGEDGRLGTALVGGVEEFAIFAVDSRDVGDYFQEAGDGEAGGIDHRFHSGAPHAGAGASKKAEARVAAAKSFDERGGIEVSRRLSGGNE